MNQRIRKKMEKRRAQKHPSDVSTGMTKLDFQKMIEVDLSLHENNEVESNGMYFRLDFETFEVFPATMHQMDACFRDSRRILFNTFIEPCIRVSTVFMPLNANMGMPGMPHLFETMVFRQENERSESGGDGAMQVRAESYIAARKTHFDTITIFSRYIEEARKVAKSTNIPSEREAEFVWEMIKRKNPQQGIVQDFLNLLDQMDDS